MNTLRGDTFKLEELKEKTVLITFWATDCRPCVQEIPHLKALHQSLASEGLKVIAISMYYDPPIFIDQMAKQYNIPYDIVLDPDGTLARAFGDIQLTPQHFLFDQKFNLVEHTLGPIDFQALDKQLKNLL